MNTFIFSLLYLMTLYVQYSSFFITFNHLFTTFSTISLHYVINFVRVVDNSKISIFNKMMINKNIQSSYTGSEHQQK